MKEERRRMTYVDAMDLHMGDFGGVAVCVIKHQLKT